MALMNVTMMPSTQGKVDFTGPPVLVSGARKPVGSMYTVSVTVSNYVGRIYFEGTLVPSPEESDWFPITLPSGNLFLAYDRATTETIGFNLRGSFAWVRARQERSHLNLLGMNEQQLSAFGFIDNITMNTGSYPR